MLNYEIHFLLLKCFHYSHKLMTQKTSNIGLYPGQPKILECLYEKDGQTPKEIGQTCVLDKSTMTSLIQKMETQQLIYRQNQLNDKRSVLIFLTELDKEKAIEVKRICYEVDQIAYQSLNQKEVNQILNQVLDNLREEYDE